jgi:hypothetical protein
MRPRKSKIGYILMTLFFCLIIVGVFYFYNYANLVEEDLSKIEITEELYLELQVSFEELKTEINNNFNLDLENNNFQKIEKSYQKAEQVYNLAKKNQKQIQDLNLQNPRIKQKILDYHTQVIEICTKYKNFILFLNQAAPLQEKFAQSLNQINPNSQPKKETEDNLLTEGEINLLVKEMEKNLLEIKNLETPDQETRELKQILQTSHQATFDFLTQILIYQQQTNQGLTQNQEQTLIQAEQTLETQETLFTQTFQSQTETLHHFNEKVLAYYEKQFDELERREEEIEELF